VKLQFQMEDLERERGAMERLLSLTHNLTKASNNARKILKELKEVCIKLSLLLFRYKVNWIYNVLDIGQIFSAKLWIQVHRPSFACSICVLASSCLCPFLQVVNAFCGLVLCTSPSQLHFLLAFRELTRAVTWNAASRGEANGPRCSPSIRANKQAKLYSAHR